MDDLLETPSSFPPNISSGLPQEEEPQSDEEEGGLDWTKLLFVLLTLWASYDLNPLQGILCATGHTKARGKRIRASSVGWHESPNPCA